MQVIRAFCGLAMLWSAGLSAAETLTLAQFTHTAPITISASQPIVVTTAVPNWVYFASHHRLLDLRVFNAAGIAVAHQLRPLYQNVTSEEFELPAIAVPAAVNSNNPVSAGTDVQLDAQGNLHIHVDESVQKTRNTVITQWVLHNSPLQHAPITGLRFEMNADTENNFEAEVSIETSADLRDWQTLVSQQKLVLLKGPQGQLAQLNINVPPSNATYWRIRSENADLKGIHHIWMRAASRSVPQFETATLSCQLTADNLRILCPMAGVLLPLSSARFDFGSQAFAFNVRVNSYSSVENPKANTLRESLQTTFTQGQPAEVSFNGSPVGYLEITMQTPGVLGLVLPPTVTVQWPAQQLSFMAHGLMPFTLAVGAEGLKQNAEQLIDPRLERVSATVAPAEVHANPVALANSQKRPWLLWSLLGAMVVLLATMALKLIREKEVI